MGDKATEWLFVGYSYKYYLELKQKMGPSSLEKSFYGHVNEYLDTYRQKYLENINRISINNHLPSFHFTRVAENNTMCHNLFMDYCYYSSIEALSDQLRGSLIFVESEPLWTVLKDLLDNNIHVKLCGSKRMSTIWQKKINRIRNVLGFIKRVIKVKILTVLYRKSKLEPIAPVTLLYLFPNDDSFTSDLKLRDSYLGGFIPYLINKNKTFFYLINPGYPCKRTISIIKWLKQAKVNGVLLEEYISLFDIIRAIILTKTLTKVDLSSIPEGNCFLSPLIKQYLEKETQGGEFAYNYLHYCFINNLKKYGIRISDYIDVYEGQIMERILRYSVRKAFPEAKLIGFAHAAPSKNHIAMFSSLKAGKIDLKPDLLLCTGDAYRDFFIKNGFKENQTLSIGDLRGYNNNLQSKPIVDKQVDHKIVLVALPLAVNDTQELFWKVIKAYNNTKNTVKIYKHPMMQLEILYEMLEGAIPENINIADEPTASGMDQCDLVVVTGSTVSVNALGRGLPVISVKRSIGLTFEPMDWFDSPIIYCETPEEIIRATDKISSMSKKELETNRIESINIARKCLDPQVNHFAIEQCLS
tara:strand:+ start:201 stop:1952 length:1752 start_codon:yes stop_codon:yes gene_type:complete